MKTAAFAQNHEAQLNQEMRTPMEFTQLDPAIHPEFKVKNPRPIFDAPAPEKVSPEARLIPLYSSFWNWLRRNPTCYFMTCAPESADRRK